MSNLLSKAVSNSTWTALGSLMTAILGFLFAGLTIRWLGEAEAGFAIAIGTVATINTTFSGLGLGTAATRLMSRAYAENNYEEIKKITGVCFSVQLGFGFVGLFLFAFGSTWIINWTKYAGNVETGRWYCILLGLVFFFGQIISYFNTILNSLQRYDWQTKLNTTFILLNGIGGITLLQAFPSILTVGIIQVILSCLNCICTGIVVAKTLSFMTRPSWNRSLFFELWSFGKWVYLTQITVTLFSGFDKILLTSIFGSATLPFYAFAQRIYQAVHTMLIGQSSYLFPMLSSQGNELEAVAERTEERLRWFIGLISAFIYSGLIIAGSTLLTIVVNANFANQTYFQLLVFSWVGYLHAQAIVPFYFGLSKGDAKGNWIYCTIVGVGYLPIFAILALTFGFQYAVLGQLMMGPGVIYLFRRDRPNISWMKSIKWLVQPLYSSLIIMFLACGVHFLLDFWKAISIIQIISLLFFYLTIVLAIPYLENTYFGGEYRTKTLSRAVTLFLTKLNLIKGN